jgi:hypothetical protein
VTGVIILRRERRLKCDSCFPKAAGHHEEATMNYKFDIFKRLPNGNTLWITAIDDLREAEKRMSRLALISSGEYFIYLQGKGIVAELNPEHQTWVEVA